MCFKQIFLKVKTSAKLKSDPARILPCTQAGTAYRCVKASAGVVSVYKALSNIKPC